MELVKMSENCDLFHEINFEHLPSQSNIYGIACITSPGQLASRVLVALLQGQIFSCEYVSKPNTDSEIKSVYHEVAFTYIPGKCHIVSIDNFSCAARGLIIGVTFCKESSGNFLNIYCNYGEDVPTGQEWNLDKVAQNCRSFDLSFTPYQLTHCKVNCPGDGNQRTVFILLGGDEQFHIYAQHQNEAEFMSDPVEEYFAELKCKFGIPVYLDIKNITEKHRLSVIGFEGGDIEALLVDTYSNTILSSWVVSHDSPISQCKIFFDAGSWHVVIVSSREEAAVYRNVLKQGFSDPLYLAGSGNYDVSTSCAVADINCDGRKEIVIGTYGHKLLAYPFNDTFSPCERIQPMWTRTFSAPILKVKFTDITGDGVDEMIVLSTKGIHVLQYNLVCILEKCKNNLKSTISQ